MKCPKCGYNSFEYLDQCKKCRRDLTAVKERCGIKALLQPPPPPEEEAEPAEQETIAEPALPAAPAPVTVSPTQKPTDLFDLGVFATSASQAPPPDTTANRMESAAEEIDPAVAEIETDDVELETAVEEMEIAVTEAETAVEEIVFDGGTLPPPAAWDQPEVLGRREEFDEGEETSALLLEDMVALEEVTSTREEPPVVLEPDGMPPLTTEQGEESEPSAESQ